MKKYKALIEFINQKETEDGFIGLKESVAFMMDLSELAKKHGFDAFARGQKKEIIDYVPSGKEIYIDKVKKEVKLEETHVNFKPINWRCKCGHGDHSYFISCPICGRENPLDGKGHLIK